jgi:hypothetical protein
LQLRGVERKAAEVTSSTARKTVHCVVGIKKGRPFAVLVARGDDATSSLDVIEILAAEQVGERTEGDDPARAAMLHALRVLGLEPSRLAAEGFEEPVMVLDEIADETTFQELRQGWAMRLLAPDDDVGERLPH